MDAQQLLACQFGSWYPRFEEVTFQSRVIDLPDGVVEYLLQDGVHLPADSKALPKRAYLHDAASDDYQDCIESEVDQLDKQEEAKTFPAFPAFAEAVNEALQALGGRAIPKLNWSCPTDAIWISSNNSLLCTNTDEVMLLLKSSDRILYDVSEAFDSCINLPKAPPQLQLALRRYVAMIPAWEFRCFVHEHALLAISQRHIQDCFPALQQQMHEILDKILDFHEAHLYEQFALADYVFDVYINSKGRVRLVDFNPVGGTTNPLLFAWEELPFRLPQQQMPAPAEPDQTMSSSRSSAMSTATRHSAFPSPDPAHASPDEAASQDQPQHPLPGAGMHPKAVDTAPPSSIGPSTVTYHLALAETQRPTPANEGRSSMLPEGTSSFIPPAPSAGQSSSRSSTTYDTAASPGFHGQLDLPQHLLPQAWDNCPVQPTTRWSDLQLPAKERQQQDSLAGFSSDSEVDISDTLTPHVTFGDQSPGQAATPCHYPQTRSVAADLASHKLSPSSLSEPTDDTPPLQHSMRSAVEQEEESDSEAGPNGKILANGVFSWCSDGVELRLVVQPNSVHLNAPRGGIPFDMVDQSKGGAIDALLAQLQAAELQPGSP